MDDEKRPTTGQDHEDQEEEQQQKRRPTSNTDLMSSAKVLADAANSAFSRDTGKIDTGEVAGAAADLLGAAKQYGNVEGKGFGKYIDQAENYLDQYNSSHSSSTKTTATESDSSDRPKTTTGDQEARPGEEDRSTKEESGGGGAGVGDYIKMAQGLFK